MDNSFLEKKKILKEKIKQDLENGQTKILLHSVYKTAFLHDKFKNAPYEKERLNNNQFSNLTNNELIQKFKKESFNNLSISELNDLFQEVYNKQMEQNNLEKKYICKVSPMLSFSSSLCELACVQDDYNLIQINENAINKFKNITDEKRVINKNTLGPFMLMTSLHEIGHCIQSENISDFYLNNKQNEKTEFMSAISLMYSSLREYSYNVDNPYLNGMLENDYEYLMEEHDADMTSINVITQLIEKDNLKNIDFISALKSFCLSSLSLNENDFIKKDKKKFINERVSEMESKLKSHLDFFDNKIKNSELKERVSNTVNDYLMSDKLKKNLQKDLSKIMETIEYCQHMETYYKSKNMMKI